MPLSPPLSLSHSPTLPASILLTIDVEDWFQVENLKSRIPFSSWDSQELRVERNTHRLLDLLDSVPCAPGKAPTPQTRDGVHNSHDQISQRTPPPLFLAKGGREGGALNFRTTPKATFFILGWIAERLPHLVTEIHRRGHEVASHGYHHELCYRLPPAVLEDDLIRSKELLEAITGAAVQGYRAPNFSISDDILKLIEDCGYRYDSSYNSFSHNSRYGKVNLPPPPHSAYAHSISQAFYELPVSNIKMGHHTLPLGGGGYFRLTPLPLFLFGIEQVLQHQDACALYLHPWEIDPHQPRIKGLAPTHGFRHYINLARTFPRLEKLFDSFAHCVFSTCRHYLDDLAPESKS